MRLHVPEAKIYCTNILSGCRRARVSLRFGGGGEGGRLLGLPLGAGLARELRGAGLRGKEALELDWNLELNVMRGSIF